MVGVREVYIGTTTTNTKVSQNVTVEQVLIYPLCPIEGGQIYYKIMSPVCV